MDYKTKLNRIRQKNRSIRKELINMLRKLKR